MMDAVMAEDEMTDPRAEERFQTAARTARRISSQCRAHAQRVTSRLSDWINSVPESAASSCGQDKTYALAGRHGASFGQRVLHLEAQCNTLSTHLEGIEALLHHDPFLALPAVPIARSIAEISASCAWELCAGVGSDERAARSYATGFRSLEQLILQLGDDDQAERLSDLRESLVAQLKAQGYDVVRLEKDGVRKPQVVQVRVGSAYAKTNFQISRRIKEEIPAVGELYASMSRLTHGEPAYLSTI